MMEGHTRSNAVYLPWLLFQNLWSKYISSIILNIFITDVFAFFLSCIWAFVCALSLFTYWFIQVQPRVPSWRSQATHLNNLELLGPLHIVHLGMFGDLPLDGDHSPKIWHPALHRFSCRVSCPDLTNVCEGRCLYSSSLQKPVILSSWRPWGLNLWGFFYTSADIGLN